MTSDACERRRAPRLRTHLRVDYCPLTLRDAGVGTTLGSSRRGVATDLSQQGLFLDRGVDLEIGSMLHLTLRLPDLPGNAVSCDARVVRKGTAKDEGLGCRFLRIHHWDSRRIAAFVARCSRAAAV